MAAGYGTDTWCAGSLRTGRLVGGKDALAQACFRRLTTPRGMLRELRNGEFAATSYGVDVAAYAGDVGDAAAEALPAVVQNELLRDDRVASVAVTATRAVEANATETLTLAVRVTASDPAESFELTAAVADGVLTLIGVA